MIKGLDINIIFGKNKIRKKLMLYFMFVTFLMAATSFYTYYNAKTLMTRLKTMYVSNVDLNSLYDDINKVQQSLESYLATKHSDSLNAYYKNIWELKQKSESIAISNSYNESGLLLTDIQNMIKTYTYESDEAVQSKRGRDINEYIAHYNEASRVFGYISLYINKLNNGLLIENTEKLIKVSNVLDFIQFMNICIIIGAVILNILLTLWFTYKITDPIIKLSHTADEISRGNYEVPELRVISDDELSVLADAFNRMISSIKANIDEIREKASLEGRLKEQEMQNLIIRSHLREAELQALQSQINPHFIFNTLNAGAQIAILEGADKTCIFVENVASLFRYNLKKLDVPVTLREEIDNINNYIYILKARFADRIDFYEILEDEVLDIKMPCMVLQPLVENAFIHGIEGIEDGGKITLIARKEDNTAVVIVKDNGQGMKISSIEEILSCEPKNEESISSKKGHTTGIGLQNVIGRLRIFFNYEDVFYIKSEIGAGTEVILKLPIKSDIKGSV